MCSLTTTGNKIPGKYTDLDKLALAQCQVCLCLSLSLPPPPPLPLSLPPPPLSLTHTTTTAHTGGPGTEAGSAHTNNNAILALAAALGLTGSPDNMKKRCDTILRARVGGRLGIWKDTSQASTALATTDTYSATRTHASPANALLTAPLTGAAALPACTTATPASTPRNPQPPQPYRPTHTLLSDPGTPRMLPAYVSEASARLLSVDASEEEMRRLAALLLTLSAAKRSHVPWTPFPGCYIAMTLPRVSKGPADTAVTTAAAVPNEINGSDAGVWGAGTIREEEPDAHKLMISVQNVAARSTSLFIRFENLPMLAYTNYSCVVPVGEGSRVMGVESRNNNVAPGKSICEHACIHACMHTYMHTYMHACLHAYIHAYIHACIHTLYTIYVYICISLYTCVYIYIYSSIHFWFI